MPSRITYNISNLWVRMPTCNILSSFESIRNYKFYFIKFQISSDYKGAAGFHWSTA